MLREGRQQVAQQKAGALHVSPRVLDERDERRIDAAPQRCHLATLWRSPAPRRPSRLFHDSITTSQLAGPSPPRGYLPVAASADSAGTLYAGELEIRL